MAKYGSEQKRGLGRFITENLVALLVGGLGGGAIVPLLDRFLPDDKHPTVSLIASQEEVRKSEQVTFTAAASDDGDVALLDITWRINSTLREENAPALDHRFDVPGSYTVLVVVEDERGQTAYDFKTIRVVDPFDSERHAATVNEIDNMIEAGRYRSALGLANDLRRTCDDAPDEKCAEIYYFIGLARRHLRRFEEAHGAMQTAIAKAPGNTVITLEFVRLNLLESAPDLALQKLDALPENERQLREVQFLLALAQVMAREHAKAAHVFERIAAMPRASPVDEVLHLRAQLAQHLLALPTTDAHADPALKSVVADLLRRKPAFVDFASVRGTVTEPHVKVFAALFERINPVDQDWLLPMLERAQCL